MAIDSEQIIEKSITTAKKASTGAGSVETRSAEEITAHHMPILDRWLMGAGAIRLGDA
jgi:hypothetical protein